MKTPDENKKEFYSIDEIKRILLTRTGIIHDQNKLYMSALDLIQQLEAENAELLTKNKQLERERDAAVADICKTCSTCKHYYYNRQDDDTADCLWFDGCKSEDHWEWRGVKEE